MKEKINKSDLDGYIQQALENYNQKKTGESIERVNKLFERIQMESMLGRTADESKEESEADQDSYSSGFRGNRGRV